MWTASRIWWTAGAVTAGVIALVLRPSRKLLVVLIERPGAFLPLLLAFVGPASVLFFALVFCGRVMAAPGLSSEGKILRVFLILLAALVVGAALVFAGCAVAFSIRHF
jgi:hypothetical protein